MIVVIKMEFKLKSFKNVIAVSKIANIHYFEFTNKYHTFKDCHEFCELVYVDNGEIYIDSDGYTGELSQNQIIIHKALEKHSLTCLDDVAPNVIIIGFECKSDILKDYSSTPVTLTKECVRLLTDVVKEGRNVFMPPYDIPNLRDMKKRKDYPFGADQMIRLKLETFFIEMIRSYEPNPIGNEIADLDTKTADIHKYIRDNFKEKINLDELCFLYNTNKTSVCKNFKSAYGDTVINFINKLKVKEAKKMLREDKYTLTQIANALNISSVHYLSRMFKNYVGVSPLEYIKTIKSKLDE